MDPSDGLDGRDKENDIRMMICSGTGRVTAGVIDIERIAIWRKKRRGKTGIDMVGSFLSYSNVERITTGEKDG